MVKPNKHRISELRYRSAFFVNPYKLSQFVVFWSAHLFSFTDWHLVAAWSMTVALLLFVLVMVWRCWNLPPVPAIRFWALGFAGMSANFLDQFWRAEAWEKEYEKLELKFQGRRLLPRPKITSTVGDKGTVGVVDCFAPLRIGTGFPPATTPFDLHIETSDFLGLSKGAIAQQNIGNIPSPFLCLVERGVLVPSLLLLPKMTLYQTPSRYITNLLWCNPSALFHSWQSVTLTKKLWNKSKRLPIPRQLQAKNFGVYNFVRIHKTLRTTPAVAAGLEFERWSLERVVEMTEAFMRRKEEAEFEKAFAEAGI